MKNLKRQLRLASLLSLILLACSLAHGQLTPTGDSYTNSAAPTTNYGAKTVLDVESTQTSFIQFNLSSIPASYTSADITQATLKLYVNAVTTAGSFNVDYVNGTWTESKIDASNAPALGTTIAASVPLVTADKNQYILVDVTAAVQAWLSGTPNDGIALVANSPLNASFDSKESTTTSHAAELDIVFAGGGTLTGITTASSSGLTGGGTSGTLNLSLTNGCATNQVLQYNGSSWVCAAVGTGTITGVTAGTDLTGGGTSGNVTLSLNTAAINGLYAQLGAANTFTANQTVTGVIISGSSGGSTAGVLGQANAASGTTYGVGGLAVSPAGYGVEGVNTASSGVGVYGLDSSGTGVSGSGTSGVSGSGTQWGVTGTSTGGTPWAGVLGSGGVGVKGEGGSGSVTGENFYQAGVWGDSGNYAVLGTNDEAIAGEFINNDSSGNYPAMVVVNDTTATHNPVFQTSSPNTYGGSRHCTIDTSANLTCTGVVSGVVQADDGKQTAVYAMQSAENWLEDAGSGQLSGGSARVELDPAFAQTVNAGVEYHVFLTPNGDSKGLYVSQKTATSFEVHEQGGGASSIAFDYRIMAKRKGYENVRLEDLTGRFKEHEPAQKTRRPAQTRAEAQPVPKMPAPLALPVAAQRPEPVTQKLLAMPSVRPAQASKPEVNQK